ncbi:hypothetical protein AN639_07150 [Candidatus Epulonipiscium fishelsonii]|uniref:Uncharacterized protein n=1 Tax=Candidatus Epulonipiscium fishelsonii TaxID=77094 RepID=A0ACC8XAS5_9FIRM|nr:hypothetical protein AN639_07150 [Epulopiscium sp. SCG-B05WGA-EpuloA1]ONI39419.1 hypothetical protein AN396_08425 [Epulopiscium sp. SCG-B11WGA-EpuloA1]
MNSFESAILIAFAFFPVLALLITLPFLIYNYRKFGAVPWLKAVLIYSFILYLLNMYCLIIFPLPSAEQAQHLHGVKMQLVPLAFIGDIRTETTFNLFNPKTYISTIKANCFYVVAFNLVMFMPLGIYLRYYFKFSLLKTFLVALGISLFFEITQLTGLYGIYNGSYRLFDVDDLIINSSGGVLGYIIAPIFTFFLPTKDYIDDIAYEYGKKVSVIREFISWCIDFLILIILTTFITILFRNLNLEAGSLIAFICIIILPTKISGNTVGQKCMKYRTISANSNELSTWQIFLKNAYIFYIMLPMPFYLLFTIVCLVSFNIFSYILMIPFLIISGIGALSFIQMFIYWIRKDTRPLVYEKLSNTRNISTIY